MNVEDIMTRHPAHIGSDASVFAALNLLKELDVRHLPVVDAGELVGMISDRDLQSLSPTELDEANLANSTFDLTIRLKQRVANLMNPNVFFVNPESPVAEVIDLMLDHRVGAIPVVDLDNSLVGIVSYFDILRAAGRAL
ncbi:MAG TPA: CBS domain-containing protein [Myxococcota bacterium]|nr:CBS domain-containing protein [Myxococcota bacterium]